MSSFGLRFEGFAALVTSALLLSCGSGTEPDPDPVPPIPTALRVVASGDLADSVGASDTLTVLLTDQNAQPIAHARLQFTVQNEAGERQLSIVDGQAEVLVQQFSTQTDGRVSVPVRRGPDVGEATVTVSYNGLRDSVKYVTRPGAPYELETQPADTGLYVGGSFVLHGRWVDRSGNVSPEVPVWTSGRPDLLSVTGTTVRAEAVGYAPAIATHGPRADTQWVAVVPRGTIAANHYPSALITIELDGSGRDTLADCSGSAPLGVEWSPDGNELVYFVRTSSLGQMALYHLELSGNCRRISEPAASHANPAFSPDGAWIYFNATIDGVRTEIWRMRPDGSEVARAGPEATGTDRDLWPQVSPDGQLLSFWTSRFSPGGLAVMSQATGDLTIRPIDAQSARWSPSGDLIAYIRDGRFRVAPPDFSSERTLDAGNFVPHSHQYYDWSPDGQWIIRQNMIGLSLIRIADGLVIPLKYLVSLESPAWRPCPGPSC